MKPEGHKTDRISRDVKEMTQEEVDSEWQEVLKECTELAKKMRDTLCEDTMELWREKEEKERKKKLSGQNTFTSR